MAPTSNPAEPLRLEYGGNANGLRIVRQAAPVGAASFSATYVGPAGWGFDPAGSEGLARAVSHLVVSAAGPYDRIALARRLDRAGATLSRHVSPESGEVTIWGPAGDWERLLELLAVVVLHPRFDADDVERVRRQFRERQLREMSQPGSRADRELLRAIYPEGHPFRSTGLGDARTLGRIERSALRRFHAHHYTSGDAVLVVTTRAGLGAVERAARRGFGPLAGNDGPRLRFPSLPAGGSLPERDVNLPGRSQVEVRLGGPSITEDTPAYPAGYLANQVLGGRPLLSRLFQRVREQNGLAYHASSHLETMRWGAYWSARAGTGPERWRRVVPMLREEVDRIRTTPVPARELTRIRESAIGEVALALESTAEAHELAVDVAYHRLPADFWISWPDRLRAVRPREVREAADIAFERRRSATVVTGPIR